jgi:hypothetical protein
MLTLLLLVTAGCKTTYRRRPLDQIAPTEKQRVYNFGKRNFESCITRQFIQISKKEATDYLASLKLEEMQHMCDWLDKQNGKFIDMQLIEVIDETYKRNCLVYRYKANFERNEVQNEIRIWVNRDGKFSGLIIRPWKDEYPGLPIQDARN